MNPDIMEFRLEGSTTGPVLRGRDIKLIDKATGRIVPFTKLRIFVESASLFAEVTVFLKEVDLETKAERVTVCPSCKREQALPEMPEVTT